MTDHIQFSEIKQALVLLDQRILPNREEYFLCKTTQDVIYALQTMVVRGAPAIGVTAAYGCWLALRQAMDQAGPGWRVRLAELLRDLEDARPTAVNLRWAVELMRADAAAAGEIGAEELSARWLAKAKAVHAEDIEINKAMGRFGAEAIDDGDTVMTHCNAGALATAGYGTALGVIRAAIEQGKRIKVIANETRPFLQGARLTAYELHKDGIDVTVACDNAVGHLMKRGMVQKVVVGADRIAANGDAANKIGTYTVALAAKAHGVPFYVAAPASTFDLRIQSGDEIPIEDRTPREVTHIGDHQITPEGVPVYNYAFDVTPAGLISGIATEKGLLRAPYVQAIKEKIGSV
ncbi:S-methyl-5-thioribose-1-phosphate isomerase [Desulfovibrio sulfodismutans]|uniref:Methylthioribose-1-phosphate isomerase n=1 Tax=Desulfolutivibrio sulfodismutans TaxID=63561 RepID=A0A7K3NMY0_9BACT|nr:S-methyl-5-thioribose-1-phosphate isomerase [Desulfolutivibrio sulfodismutans]NDY57487.1 S-methyl-5-thioribose-1-phosphate isomerase [Desulfolutivibrio sulfodismutans]QLA14298.1 S-methyl-5-thioribose-1-phosphate isomerase [Desulfolutivibrio sulfodismutans DSM 3696]